MTATPLAIEVEQRLHESAELHIAVEEDEGKLVLTGLVADERERATALEVVQEVAPGVTVEDNLEVAGALPEGMSGTLGSPVAPAAGEFETTDSSTDRESALEPGDFTAQEAMQFGDAAAGPTSAFDEDEAGEGNEVFTPPTDPVGTDREVIGGLQRSASD